MSVGTYRIVYPATPSNQRWAEKVEAEQIGDVHDGAVAGVNLLDESDEVLRVRSDSVERVERVH